MEVIDRISQPIFFIHGRADPIISVDETVALHYASNNPEDRIWLVSDAEHVNVYRKNQAAYVREVAYFFDQHIP